jgi:hypothetical protein
MRKNTSPHKEFANTDINKIINCFVDLNNICRTCGQDHSSTPKYEDKRSSIDFLNNSKENSNPLK